MIIDNYYYIIMQCEIQRDILVTKTIKKYSIDLSIFSSSDNHGDFDFDICGREVRKMRKMTYDFSQYTERASNPI